jgi:hypothetical protein
LRGGEACELAAEVLEVGGVDIEVEHFLDDRQEVGERADGSEGWRTSGTYQPACGGENQGVVDDDPGRVSFVELRCRASRNMSAGSWPPTVQPCGSRSEGPLMRTVWQ